jgi:hypothetical protein
MTETKEKAAIRVAEKVLRKCDDGYCPLCDRDEGEGFMRDGPTRGHSRDCPVPKYVEAKSV